MGIQVEVFVSRACPRCVKAAELVRRVADEYGATLVHWRAVNVLADMDYAVSLGVLGTPSIAINGALVFTGQPTEKALRAALRQVLSDDSQSRIDDEALRREDP